MSRASHSGNRTIASTGLKPVEEMTIALPGCRPQISPFFAGAVIGNQLRQRTFVSGRGRAGIA